jgi:hypothetical protein
MQFHAYIAALLAVAGSVAEAVNFKAFRTATCNGNYVVCNGLPRNSCCTGRFVNGANVFASGQFTGLFRTELGNVCTQSGSKKCGTIRKSANNAACLGYNNLKGGYYFECISKCRRDETMPNASAQEPDAISIDGHMFNLTAASLSQQEHLHALAFSDTLFADMPTSLLEHEVPNNDVE